MTPANSTRAKKGARNLHPERADIKKRGPPSKSSVALGGPRKKMGKRRTDEGRNWGPEKKGTNIPEGHLPPKPKGGKR